VLPFPDCSDNVNPRFFTLNWEIHGELGTVHAMNFGRTYFYLECDVTLERKTGVGHGALFA